MQSTQESTQQVRKRRRYPKLPTWLLIALLGGFIIAALATAYLTFVVVGDLVAEWRSPDIPELVLETTPGVQSTAPPDLGERGNQPLQEKGRPQAEDWDGQSRINLLVMGLDHREWEDDGGAPRTDTMILLSLDPVSRTAGMLSIPRDLWVDIPGYDPAKINNAYRLGELYNEKGGGPGLAIQTVEKLLGMEIDYYAQIDFTAFENFIDEIGGVELDVPEEINIDPLGDNNNKVLQPGRQVLPGRLALAYARARNTAGSDFDRAARQQQVIMGIRARLLEEGQLPTLIQNAPMLYDLLSEGIHTNLTILQVIRMAWVAQQVPAENIHQGVIGMDQVTQTYSFDGQDILVPNAEAIRQLRDAIFTTEGAIAPAATQTNPLELVGEEAARVEVLNGTQLPGLASTTVDYLMGNGLNSVEPGNAEDHYPKTTLIDYTGNPHTIEYLTSLLSITPENIYHRYDVSNPYDIVLLLGDDWATSNPMP
jgi:LCP family protein required for cell wall assembly